MEFAELHPYVYHATRYPFSEGQASRSRICYSSSLYLISDGKGQLVTRGMTYQAAPGSLVYIPAGQKHDWIADQEDPMIHVCCYFDWAYTVRVGGTTPHLMCWDESHVQPSLLGPLFPFPIPEHSYVDKIWLWVEWFGKFYTSNLFTNEKTYVRNLQVQAQFQLFIEFFLKHALREEHIPDPRIYKLLEHLDQDLLKGGAQPLEAYYRKLRISRGYFFDLFKQATGMSPIQYINHFKMHRAKEDLQSSNLSITKIAEKHRFSSVHYFSKRFRQMTGKSPKEFREGI